MRVKGYIIMLIVGFGLIFHLACPIECKAQLSKDRRFETPIELLPDHNQYINVLCSLNHVRKMGIYPRKWKHPKKQWSFNEQNRKVKLERFNYEGNLHFQIRYLYTNSRGKSKDTLIIEHIRESLSSDTFKVEQSRTVKFVDSTVAHLYDHPRQDYMYIHFELFGNIVRREDRTPKWLQRERALDEAYQRKQKFAHKGASGYNFSTKDHRNKRGQLIEQEVHEYYYYIASTPEYTNEKRYNMTYKYYKNGLLKAIYRDKKLVYTLKYAFQ